jgi:alkylhydroperoxidase family enzyme
VAIGSRVSYVDPPGRIPLLPRLLLWMVERRMGKKLLANRILSWYPRAFLGSGIMEGLVAHDEPEVPRRLLALIRMYTSFLVSCPFCIDMNSRAFETKGITGDEIGALQGRVPIDLVPTFTPREKAALHYVECMCRTPLAFTTGALENVKRNFSARGFVILASTCAQVNFWTRLIQSLGVPPAGFSAECSLLNLEAYETLKRD